jgi:methyl-accepting chemotaxis protein
MSDDVFRIVITVAVILACLAFVVQAIVALALYRVVRALQRKVSPLVEKGEAVAGKAGPVIDKVGPLLDQARPVVEKIGPLLDQARPVIQRAGATVDQAAEVLTTTHKILEEMRPRIVEITTEVSSIAKTGRGQVEKVGELLHDASERAEARLEQIDRTVDNTVEQMEKVGESVKTAVMRPVREVNGIAAGISAVLSTLTGRPRKSSVDSATQDEEMFI